MPRGAKSPPLGNLSAMYGYNPLEGERRDAGGVEVLPTGHDVRGRRAEGEIHSRHIRPG